MLAFGEELDLTQPEHRICLTPMENNVKTLTGVQPEQRGRLARRFLNGWTPSARRHALTVRLLSVTGAFTEICDPNHSRGAPALETAGSVSGRRGAAAGGIVMASDVQHLTAFLATIRRLEPSGERILSIYLDTSPAAAERQAYLLAYRDLAKLLREQLSESERDSFEIAATKAEAYLTEQLKPGHPGLALFVSPSPDFFYTQDLPRPVAEQMVWDDTPLLQPIVAILNEEVPAAIVLFDAGHARLYLISSGEVEERRTLEGDVPGKQRTGGWAALRQSRIARRREDHLLHLAHQTVEELLLLAASHPYDRLVLGGPPEALAVLRNSLPSTLRRRVVGRISIPLFASEHEVMEAARRVLDADQRCEESRFVGELLDADATARVVLGMEETLAALSEGRVQTLLIAQDFSGEGGQCSVCGQLTVRPGRCPVRLRCRTRSRSRRASDSAGPRSGRDGANGLGRGGRPSRNARWHRRLGALRASCRGGGGSPMSAATHPSTIFTVTLNPALDEAISIESLAVGETNRCRTRYA